MSGAETWKTTTGNRVWEMRAIGGKEEVCICVCVGCIGSQQRVPQSCSLVFSVFQKEICALKKFKKPDSMLLGVQQEPVGHTTSLCTHQIRFSERSGPPEPLSPKGQEWLVMSSEGISWPVMEMTVIFQLNVIKRKRNLRTWVVTNSRGRRLPQAHHSCFMELLFQRGAQVYFHLHFIFPCVFVIKSFTQCVTHLRQSHLSHFSCINSQFIVVVAIGFPFLAPLWEIERLFFLEKYCWWADPLTGDPPAPPGTLQWVGFCSLQQPLSRKQAL